GCGDTEYLAVFDQLLIPIARQFNPEFVLISSGFDCHRRDPLGGMSVTAAGFTAMTRRVKRLAAECCAGKLVAVLEGGYDLQALTEGGRAVIQELGREADEPITPAATNPRVGPVIERARHFLSPYWQLN
ncbi:MAG: histone deacetylase, partial [Candidatus Binataceae bacterium]